MSMFAESLFTGSFSKQQRLTRAIMDSVDELMKPLFNSQSNSKKITCDEYLKRIEGETIDINNRLIRPPNDDDYDDNKYTLYFNCPICHSQGLKTIKHIKLCAAKNCLNAKDTICLMRKASKTTRRKLNSKPIKLNIQVKCSKNKNYSLLSSDDKFRKELAQRKISKLVSKGFTRAETSTDSVDLPSCWTKSYLLDTDYILPGFEQYFT